jgi:hypothetical protein
MGDVQPLPRRQEIFVDERGVGLRVTWHPEREMVVLSVWHGATCTASFRLAVADLPRLTGFLSSVMGDWTGEVLAARPRPPKGNGRPDDERVAAGGEGYTGREGVWQRRLGLFRLPRLPRRQRP